MDGGWHGCAAKLTVAPTAAAIATSDDGALPVADADGVGAIVSPPAAAVPADETDGVGAADVGR